MPATAELAAAAMLVAILCSIPLGIVAAVGRGTSLDHGAMTLALAGVSIPNFWLGPLLAIIFSVELGWLPVSGRGTLAHLVLPAFSLGAALAAIPRADDARDLARGAARAVRRGRARTWGVARACGDASRLSQQPDPGGHLDRTAVRVGAHGCSHHRNNLCLAGIGRLLIQSIGFRDYPLVQGCILLIAVTYVGVNLLTDLVYGILDPRIRYE
jgi:hypothetical protein